MLLRFILHSGGIDITTTASYDWNVNIASDAFSSNDFWVFRFTFFDSDDSFAQQISSPGFKISGLIKASSTAAISTSSKFTLFRIERLCTRCVCTLSSNVSVLVVLTFVYNKYLYAK